MKTLLKIIIGSSLLISLLPVISFAQNSGGYQPLAPITGVTPPNVSTADLSGYLESLFEIGVSVAGALAVIMIVIGGIQYMSTDAIGGKEAGKERITQAVWGLLLALVSYLILLTINPQLVQTNLSTNLTAVKANGLSNTAADAPSSAVTVPTLTGDQTTVTTPNGTAISTGGNNTINLGTGPAVTGNVFSPGVQGGTINVPPSTSSNNSDQLPTGGGSNTTANNPLFNTTPDTSTPPPLTPDEETNSPQ
jgi:hypothetical protein